MKEEIREILPAISALIAVICMMFFILNECEDKRTESYVRRCVKMQKLNSEWIEECYKLPKDGKFKVKTYRGSYELYCDGIKVRAGIIDFKLID